MLLRTFPTSLRVSRVLKGRTQTRLRGDGMSARLQCHLSEVR